MTTINGGKILLRLDDGNTIELYTKKTKQAKKATDDLNRTEQTLNRNFKGASRQSSNTTKNFSKMAQGITGGLVPAYATLAANIFAITAAFRFLKDAADLRILEQGQLEYSQRTGQSLAILTRQLQAATGAQLAFAEAAQAVAIGTAAGLSAQQINELGVVAKNASLMLGRDLTDSFNRLVRGAVKAEPELLDELGIILRLDTATEKYALSIGKAKNQLNIFEKSQAVVNEVLEQGEEKFGGVETQINELGKLAKAFDDLINTVKRAIGPMAEFMATVLQQNTVATAGMGILAGTQLIKAVTPDIPATDLKAELRGVRSFVKTEGVLTEAGKAKFGKLKTQQELQNFERSLRAKKSKFLDYTNFTKREHTKMLLVIKANNLRMQADHGNALDKMKFKFLSTLYVMQAEYGKFVGTMKFLGRGLLMAVSFIGYAGIAISLFGILKQLMDKSDEATRKYKAAQKEFGELYSRNAEDLEKTIRGLKTQNSLMTNALQTARALSNIDFSNLLMGLEGGPGSGRSSLTNLSRSFLGPTMSNLLQGAGMKYDVKGLTREHEQLSEAQIKGLEGVRRSLAAEQTLLIKNSDAYDQHNDLIKLINDTLKANTDGVLMSSGAYEALIKGFSGVAEEGTIAQNTMKGLGTTTQILAASASDFEKTLNSFKAPQTQLTKLTTNIQQAGSALSGLGEQFSKMQAKMDFKVGGTTFDKGTMSMLSTFLSEKDLEIIKAYDRQLNSLAKRRDFFEEIGDTKTAEKYQERITKVGAIAFGRIGEKTEAEAKRLHDLEMKMIRDKTKVQTNLVTLSIGATKLQTNQLQKQSKLAQNQIDIRNQQIYLAELENLGLKRDDAQVVAEEQKLLLMQQQGIALEKQLDDQYLLGQAAKNAFETGISGGLNELMTGQESSFKDAMAKVAKGVFEGVSKQLSDQMSRGISNFLFGNKEMETYQRGAEIIRQAHIDGIQQGMGTKVGDITTGSDDTGFFGKTMNFLGTFGSFFGFAKGGITPVYAASGGMFKGPKSGYPAMLHGNEAVVPLPDGRSIPVSGGMGGNVNVSINMTTGETSTTSNDAEQMNAIGQSIAQAVQNELERQQRPGGMLAPY